MCIHYTSPRSVHERVWKQCYHVTSEHHLVLRSWFLSTKTMNKGIRAPWRNGLAGEVEEVWDKPGRT